MERSAGDPNDPQIDPEVLLAQLEEAIHENQALRNRALALNVEIRRLRAHLDQLDGTAKETPETAEDSE